MSLDLTIQNRQRTRAIDLRQLRRICAELLREHLRIEKVELGITLVAAAEMTRLNEAFLHHEGSTDVITFDYHEPGTQGSKSGAEICGELIICVDESVSQAKRFRTTWQSELIRYIVHGVLHLLGYDDRRAADRRRMKQEEERLLRLLTIAGLASGSREET